MKEHRGDKWLSVFCPESSCLREEEQVVLPENHATGKVDKWLQAFCPENSCISDSASELV